MLLSKGTLPLSSSPGKTFVMMLSGEGEVERPVVKTERHNDVTLGVWIGLRTVYTHYFI